jgi:hypothetical protein
MDLCAAIERSQADSPLALREMQLSWINAPPSARGRGINQAE